MPAGRRHRPCQRGFTYIVVMTLVALLGIGLAAIGPMWAEQGQREREGELLRVGTLYAQAIADYRRLAPGSLNPYPPDLESLLLDTRFAGTQRHLRKLYKDPMDPARPWGIVRAPDGGVQGVYSLDERTPLRRVGIDLGPTALPVAQRYADWKFMPKGAP